MNRNNYNIKKLQRLNNVDQSFDKNALKDAIIKPITVNKPKENIVKQFNVASSEYTKKIEEYWKKRVNQPYKGIIKDYDYNKKIQNEQDLIIHKVTNADKKNFEKNVTQYETQIKEQNTELKQKFSVQNLKEHKKEFEKEHKYKYINKHGAAEVTTTDELRTDRIEYYKKEQEKTEKNKKQIDELLNELVQTGVIDDQLNNINYDKIDINSLENKLLSMLGEEEYKKMVNS